MERLLHESFTGTRITGQENATWDLGTKFFVFLWILQEVDDFAQVLLSGFVAGDVREKNFLFLVAIKTSFCFAEAHGLIVHVLSLAHHTGNEDDNNNNRNDNDSDVDNDTEIINLFFDFDTNLVLFGELIKALLLKRAGAIFSRCNSIAT